MAQRMPATLERSILEIRLNRTEKNNTLTPAMYGALADTILDGDRAARAGSPATAMPSPAATTTTPSLTPRPGATEVSTPTVSCWRPRSLKIPMITAINGMAIGAGGWHGGSDLR